MYLAISGLNACAAGETCYSWGSTMAPSCSMLPPALPPVASSGRCAADTLHLRAIAHQCCTAVVLVGRHSRQLHARPWPGAGLSQSSQLRPCTPAPAALPAAPAGGTFRSTGCHCRTQHTGTLCRLQHAVSDHGRQPNLPPIPPPCPNTPRSQSRPSAAWTARAWPKWRWCTTTSSSRYSPSSPAASRPPRASGTRRRPGRCCWRAQMRAWTC